MKNVKLLFCFFVILSTSVTSLSYGESTREIRKTVNFGSLEFVQQGRYLKIELKGEGDYSYTFEPGKPMLPFYTITFTFSLGTEIIDVEVVQHHVKRFTISKKILPTPQSILMDNCNLLDLKKKRYSETYPWYSYHMGGGILSGKHVTFLSIHIYPVRYYPAEDLLEYTDEAEVIIKYREGIGFPEENETDLLIISPLEFLEALKPLSEHKDQMEIKTVIVTLEDIYDGSYFPVQGRDEPEKIKYFIKDAIENWGVKYVLLVGGKDKLPVRICNLSSSSPRHLWSFISDLYYADIYDANGEFCSWDSNNNSIFGEMDIINESIDKVDLYPDVYIGRLLCRNSSEVRIIVNKIINYENNSNKSWFNNLVLCGGDTHPLWRDILCSGRVAWEGEYVGDRIIEIMEGFKPRKIYASSIFPFGDKEAEKLTVENINRAINEGAGFVVFSGHGETNGWATRLPFLKRIWLPLPKGYSEVNVLDLRNKDKLPVVVLDACSCGDFSIDDSPLAWDFVKLENGGAIASFACTTVAWTLAGPLCIKTLNGYITTHLFKAYSEGKRETGVILVEAINDYLNNLDISRTLYLIFHYKCIEYWELFGDPSLKIGDSK